MPDNSFQRVPFNQKTAYSRNNPESSIFPSPIVVNRAPTTSDTNYALGQVWINNASSPKISYEYLGGGTWETGGNADASSSEAGIVMISTDIATDYPTDDKVPTVSATKDYVDSVVVAGAPVSTEVTQGIGELATDAEAIAGTASTALKALLVTPSNLSPVFASPPVIGGTTAAAGTFTDLTADGTGDVSLGSANAADFTVASGDLTLEATTGSVIINGEEAVDDSIQLTSAAGGLAASVALSAVIESTEANADSMQLISAGGMDLTATGASGKDIDIVCTSGSVNITGGENIASSVVITNKGFQCNTTGAAGQDILLSNTGGSVQIIATEAVSDAVNIDSSGGVDVDAVGKIALTSTQSAADSIAIESTLGGIDILASGASAGEDIDIIATGSSVNVVSTENAAQSIYIRANGGTSETIDIHSDQGTGTASVNIRSDVGGVTITSGLSSADAVNITASAAGSGIDIDAGTAGVIVDTTGGISLDAAAASNFTATGAFDLTLNSTAGSVIINGEEAVADAIQLTSVAGGLTADVGLQIVLDSAEPAVADSIRIVASAADGGGDFDFGSGGFTLDSTGAISIDGAAASNFSVSGVGIDLTLASSGGRVVVNGEEAAADAVRILSAAGGLDADVALQMSLVSSQNAADAIVINASSGGIDLTAAGGAAEDIDIVNTAGSVNITAGEVAADSMVLTSNGLDIVVAGAAGRDIDMVNTGGSVNIESTEAVSDAITIDASNASGGVTISSGTGGVNVSGDLNLVDVATKLSYNGGAATDFIGTGVLTAGTQTISNTNIAATDRIFLSRTAVNASTTLGVLTYTISAGASFTVTSVILGTPGSTQTGDVSSYAYVIIGQD